LRAEEVDVVPVAGQQLADVGDNGRVVGVAEEEYRPGQCPVTASLSVLAQDRQAGVAYLGGEAVPMAATIASARYVRQRLSLASSVSSWPISHARSSSLISGTPDGDLPAAFDTGCAPKHAERGAERDEPHWQYLLLASRGQDNRDVSIFASRAAG
jgi:hypothetical protein